MGAQHRLLPGGPTAVVTPLMPGPIAMHDTARPFVVYDNSLSQYQSYDWNG
jgi:hypothetical protein